MAIGVEGFVEDDDLGCVAAVVEGHERHLAAPARLHAQGARRCRRCSTGSRGGLQRAQALAAPAERARPRSASKRMPGKIEAEARFLLRQPLGSPTTRAPAIRARCGRSCAVFAEQRHLRGGALGPLGHDRARRRPEASRRCAPRIDRVEGAGADQRLDGAAIDEALVHPPAEIEQVGERAARFRARRRSPR